MKSTQSAKIRTFLIESGLELHPSISIGKYSYMIYRISGAIISYIKANSLDDSNTIFTFPRNTRRSLYDGKRISIGGKRISIGEYIFKQFIDKSLIDTVKKGSFDLGIASTYTITSKYKYNYINHIKSQITLFGMEINQTTRGRLIKITDKDLHNEFIGAIKPSKELNSIETNLLNTLKSTKLDISIEDIQLIESLPEAKRNSYWNRLLAYHNADHWVSESTLSCRLYSSFASLPTILRKKVKILDPNTKTYCSLGSIDLKAAQPFLLSYVPELQDDDYNDIIRNNDIYNWCISKLDQTKIPDIIVDKSKKNGKEYKSRAWMKVEFYRFIFTSTSYHSVVDYILEQHLPDFFEKVKKYKKAMIHDSYLRDNDGNIMYNTVMNKGGKAIKSKMKKENSTNLATILQSIEASIFIPVWCEYSKSTIPLHDSLYFPINTRIDYRSKIIKALHSLMSMYGYSGYQFNEE